MPPLRPPYRLLRAVSAALVSALPALAQPPAAPATPGSRLEAAASPYVRSHRGDPVDWWPWGPEALAHAAREQKPILLTIGYSACHWCHVMATESFADPAVARLLNESFVCIVVDREERPDVDELGLAALSAMGQEGGWPTTLFLTPAGTPFFGGTYFPKEDSGGLPAFRRVVEKLATAWRDRRGELEKGATELAAHLRASLAPTPPPGEPDAALLAGVLPALRPRCDAEHGGFGDPPRFSPKFPEPALLAVLLHHPDPAARELLRPALAAIRDRALCDQLGGGFHRYTVDRAWTMPHFEKMLYDNALLAGVFADAAVVDADPADAAAARAALDFVLRDLRDPAGGFRSSLDADSDGGEGRFYQWTDTQLREALGDDHGALAKVLTTAPAAPFGPERVLLRAPGAEPADPAAARVLTALRTARERRPRPRVDDKVLTAWNGLAIAAFAAAAPRFAEPRWLAAAQGAADFALRELVHDGRCRRSWSAGAAGPPGVLEDHAMLADGLLTLFEADGDPRWLAAARALLRTIDAHFTAPGGGLFTTADDHGGPLPRARSSADGALPSGAGVAARAFLRLGLLLGDDALTGRGTAVLRAEHELLAKAPAEAGALLLALQFHLGDPRTVVVAGEPGDPRTLALLAAARRAFPRPQVLALVNERNRGALQALSTAFSGVEPRDGVPTAYVCRAGRCGPPLTDPDTLAATR